MKSLQNAVTNYLEAAESQWIRLLGINSCTQSRIDHLDKYCLNLSPVWLKRNKTCWCGGPIFPILLVNRSSSLDLALEGKPYWPTRETCILKILQIFTLQVTAGSVSGYCTWTGLEIHFINNYSAGSTKKMKLMTKTLFMHSYTCTPSLQNNMNQTLELHVYTTKIISPLDS